MKSLFAIAFCTAIVLLRAQTAPDQFRAEVAAQLPAFARWGVPVGNSIPVLDQGGKVIATLLTAPENRTGRTEGFKDVVNVAVLLGNDGRILAVLIGKNRETPRFLQRVRDGGLLRRWNGRTPAEAAAMTAPRPVTGATWSSEAIKAEVRDILAAHGDRAHQTGAPSRTFRNSREDKVIVIPPGTSQVTIEFKDGQPVVKTH